MHKLLMAAVAAAVAVAGFAVFAFANPGPQGTSLEITLSKTGKDKPTGANTVLEPAKRDTKGTDDPSDDHYTSPSKSVIKLAKGSEVNTAALPRCKASESDLQRGTKTCPKNTKIGAGVAQALLGQPDDGAGTPIVSLVDAFNYKGGQLMMIVTPCSPGTGPGTGAPCSPFGGSRVPLPGDWSKVETRPTLTVETPASFEQANIIITEFQLKIRLIKTDDGAYARTPDTCGGTWRYQAVETYPDGSTLKINDTQNC